MMNDEFILHSAFIIHHFPSLHSPITIPFNMGILRTAAMVVGLGLAASAYAVDANVPQLSEFRDGRWQVVEGPATQPTNVEPDPELDSIERLIGSGQYKPAK